MMAYRIGLRSGRAPVRYMFTDRFDRANEALEANARWQQVSGVAGAMSVDANRVRSNDVSVQATYLLSASLPIDLVNHFIQADWYGGTTTGWLLARYAGEADYIGMQILAAVPTLYTRIGGAFVVIGASAASVTPGDRIRIECFGQTIRLFHKYILRAAVTLNPGVLVSGRVGVQARSALANPVLDNVTAGSL